MKFASREAFAGSVNRALTFTYDTMLSFQRSIILHELRDIVLHVPIVPLVQNNGAAEQ